MAAAKRKKPPPPELERIPDPTASLAPYRPGHWGADDVEVSRIKSVSPLNPRRLTKADDLAIDSLAESIQQNGILEPLLIRPAAGAYELLAGKRRFAAAQRAGLKIVPCRILHESDDATARAAIAIENLQREQLSPLEESAAVANLLDADHSIESAAVCLGQSPHWVAGRARLAQLAPSWREAMADPEHPASHWSVAHLVEVAKLPTESQDSFCRRVGERWQRANYVAISVVLLRSAIAWQYALSLTAAKWRLDDAELVPAAGSCTACAKRTAAEPLLWPDLADAKSDRCLSETCYRAKESAVVKTQAAALKRRHNVEPIGIAENKQDFVLDNEELPLAEVVSEWQVVPAKATDSRARPAVYVDGPNAGKTTWVIPPVTTKPDYAAKPAATEGPKSLAIKRLELERRRKAKAVELFRVALDDEEYTEDKLPIDTFIRLLAVFGTDTRANHAYGAGSGNDSDWNRYRDLCRPTAEPYARLWENLRAVFNARLHLSGPIATTDTAERAWKECGELCNILGLKSQHFLDEAEAEIKEPRSWAADAAGQKKSKR